MQGILYEEQSGWVFLVLTVLIGGGTAYLTGRAVAHAWRPVWTLGVYVLLLAVALRFLHFALFDGSVIDVLIYAAYVWLVGRAGSVFGGQVAYIVTGCGVLWAMALLGES